MLRRPSATSGLGPLTAPYKQLVHAEPTKASAGDHARFHPSRVRPSPGSAGRAHALPTPGRPKGFQRRLPPGQRLPTTTPRLGGSDAPNVLCVSALGRLAELCPCTPCSAIRPPGLPSTIKTAALETNQQACSLHAEYTHPTHTHPTRVSRAAPAHQAPLGCGLRGDHRQSSRAGLTIKWEETEKQKTAPQIGGRGGGGGRRGSETMTASKEPGWWLERTSPGPCT